ncbi:MAG TPA: helicase C-terminal domain-containing protein [Thermoanaerobaculia bacterium]|nr:helicase C-terminal domain-containing protein [Thermoanaerobaculia bacterium]
MRFDETTKTFEVNARELAEDEGFRRVGFDRGEGWRRLGLGTQIHSRILSARKETFAAYRCEVHLQARIPVEDWTAILTGRLDGCLEREAGYWLIEEFKSTDLPSEGIRPSGYAFERDRRQLLAYCYLWKRLGHPRVSAALVYVDIGTGEEVSIAVPYDEESCEGDIERRLGALLRMWRAQAAIRARKAKSAERLPFPHTAPRPIQEKLMEAVARAVSNGENLIAEAPTGSGKTAAVLYPALREGLTSGKQVVFLTSKTLQQKMAVSALTAMNERTFATVQVRAKEKMCANDRILCHEEFCRFARGYPEKMAASNILGRLRERYPHQDPDTVFEEARREEVCPFEVQLELAGRADAIVADYNYVFEPAAAMRHLVGEELKDVILLVDEAHNLPDRARRIFSPEILEEDFRPLLNHLILQPGALFASLCSSIEEVLDLLHEAASELPEEGDAIAETLPPADAIHALRADWEPRLLAYLAWKRDTKLALPDDPVMDAHYALQRFAAVLNMWGSDFTCVVERRAAGIRLALVCLDPARALAPVFSSASSTVLLSATLTPPEAFERVLGLERDRTSSLSLPPPFPPENRKVMILPQVRTTYKAREENCGRIAKLVAEMAEAHTGNALVLFPSYRFLADVAAAMPPTRARLLVQRADLSDFERQQILQALASPPPGGILLFAVSGGMYAEGVDYPGELLSAVFVVSPALPQVSFERELLRRYFEEQEEAGFDYAYLQPGMTRVVQAAGRLIRSETDRGVIALICRRFLEKPYARYLPRDWYGETPRELVTDRPADEIREFFGKYGQ